MQSFQFTRPRGARQTTCHAPDEPDRFNSRAHGGRDVFRPVVRPHELVSIHAPTGGATIFRRKGVFAVRVSIHAPTGGATSPAPAVGVSCRFNSRAHGGRDIRTGRRRPCDGVSIHAPTGGATV